jgi:hypothetical protein
MPALVGSKRLGGGMNSSVNNSLTRAGRGGALGESVSRVPPAPLSSFVGRAEMPPLDSNCLRAYLRSTEMRDWLSWCDQAPQPDVAEAIRGALSAPATGLPPDAVAVRAYLLGLASDDPSMPIIVLDSPGPGPTNSLSFRSHPGLAPWSDPRIEAAVPLEK